MIQKNSPGLGDLNRVCEALFESGLIRYVISNASNLIFYFEKYVGKQEIRDRIPLPGGPDQAQASQGRPRAAHAGQLPHE